MNEPEIIPVDSMPVAKRRTPTPKIISPMDLIHLAVKQGDLDKLERLIAMNDRIQAQAAEQEFNGAMARVQSEMRKVSTDAQNPQTRSRYASYAAIDKALRPIYGREGFSLSFDTADAPAPETIRVLCLVSHQAGHTRTYHIDMPADGKGAKGNDVMTKTHASGSAMTYGMRYLVKMIFNVAVGEADDDGNGAITFEVEEGVQALEQERNIASLMETFKGLFEKARITKNMDALNRYIAAKDKRKKELMEASR